MRIEIPTFSRLVLVVLTCSVIIFWADNASAQNCRAGQSDTLTGDPVVFDNLSNTLSKASRRERLFAIAIELKLRPEETLFAISYAGKRASVNESLRNLENIKLYLLEKKIDTSRFILVDGGHRNTAQTEFYFIPKGATPPQPSSTISPEEVILKRL